ncbi:cationic amino acid transporter, putative, partial [Trypanosoma cruzi]
LALTGMVKYTSLNVDAPVIMALREVGAPPFLRILVDIGTISGLSSVCFACHFAMPRLVMALAKDGLLPPVLSCVHPRLKTPVNATLFCGVAGALIGGLFPLEMLGEIISLGTLVAFTIVCVSMWKIRIDFPDFPRPFVAPFFPFVPLLGVTFNSLQMFFLPLVAWRNYIVVVVISLSWYLFYGIRHSKLHTLDPSSWRGFVYTESGTAPHSSKEEGRMEEACSLELPMEMAGRRRTSFVSV